MKSSSGEWGTGESNHEERYWEKVLEEAQLQAERQFDALSSGRRSLFKYIYYHLIFIGFVLTLNSAVIEGKSDFLGGFFPIAAIAPSLIGIMITSIRHNSSGGFVVGYDSDLFHRISKDADSYTEGLKGMINAYEDLHEEIEKTNTKVGNCRYYNALLLAIGFGILSGIIAWG